MKKAIIMRLLKVKRNVKGTLAFFGSPAISRGQKRKYGLALLAVLLFPEDILSIVNPLLMGMTFLDETILLLFLTGRMAQKAENTEMGRIPSPR